MGRKKQKKRCRKKVKNTLRKGTNADPVQNSDGEVSESVELAQKFVKMFYGVNENAKDILASDLNISNDSGTKAVPVQNSDGEVNESVEGLSQKNFKMFYGDNENAKDILASDLNISNNSATKADSVQNSDGEVNPLSHRQRFEKYYKVYSDDESAQDILASDLAISDDSDDDGYLMHESRSFSHFPLSMDNPTMKEQFEKDMRKAAEAAQAEGGEMPVPKMWISSTLSEGATASGISLQKNLSGLTSGESSEREGASPQTKHTTSPVLSSVKEQDFLKEIADEVYLQNTRQSFAATGAIPKRQYQYNQITLAGKLPEHKTASEDRFLKNISKCASWKSSALETGPDTEYEERASKLSKQGIRTKDSSQKHVPGLFLAKYSTKKGTGSKTENEETSSDSSCSDLESPIEVPPEENVDYCKCPTVGGARPKIRSAQPPSTSKRSRRRIPKKVPRRLSNESTTDNPSESTTGTPSEVSEREVPLLSEGEIIAQFTPFVYVLFEKNVKLYCSFCFKRLQNSEVNKCDDCSSAFYCNGECQKEHLEIHEKECDYRRKFKNKEFNDFSRLLAQFIEKVENLYSTEFYDVVGNRRYYLDDMQHFSDQAQNMRKYSVMCTAEYNHSKDYMNYPVAYRHFCMEFAKCYKHHLPITDFCGEAIGLGVYLGLAAFEHACKPNAMVVFDGHTALILARQDFGPRNLEEITLRRIEVMVPKSIRLAELCIYSGGVCRPTCALCEEIGFEQAITKTESKFENKKTCKKLLDEIDQEIDRSNLEDLFNKNISVLGMLKKCIEEAHYLRVKALQNSGILSRRLERHSQATVYYYTLLTYHKLHLGSDDPKTLMLTICLADSYARSNKPIAAKQYYAEALEALSSYGTDNPLYEYLGEKLDECDRT